MSEFRSAAAVAALLGAMLLLTSTPSLARVKLTTLPQRDRVEIQLDHPTATLVEEERVVPLIPGANQIDFAWANTRIDPGSILLRVLAPRTGVEVVSVSYPPGENALVWSVAAAAAGPARIRISYLIGDLTKSFSYRAVVSEDETRLELARYLRIRNSTQEEFRDAGIWIGPGAGFTRSIGLDETREILVSRSPRVPVERVYRVDPRAIGYLDRARDELRVAVHYRIRNDKRGNLGLAPLPAGKVRIFQRRDGGESVFIGEDRAKLTAVGEELSLGLGLARDIVVKRVVERRRRQRVAGNLFHQEIVVRYEIENFKAEPVTLELVEEVRRLRRERRRDGPGDVEWGFGPDDTLGRRLDRERTTAERLVLRLPLPAASAGQSAAKQIQRLHLILKNEW